MDVPGLKGRVAVITAAGQNIGKAVALAFARAGSHIVITGGSDAAKIEAVAGEARSLGVEAIASICDGTDETAMNALVQRAVAELGGVDIAVSCVGIRPHQPIEEISLQDWQKVINTNLGSAFILTRRRFLTCAGGNMAACFIWPVPTRFSRWRTGRMWLPRNTACTAWRRPWRWNAGLTG